MRDYAKGIEVALISYERTLMKGAEDALSTIVSYCTDDELREMARSGKMDLFMQKTLFNIIRKRREEASGFRKFMNFVIGKA